MACAHRASMPGAVDTIGRASTVFYGGASSSQPFDADHDRVAIALRQLRMTDRGRGVRRRGRSAPGRPMRRAPERRSLRPSGRGMRARPRGGRRCGERRECRPASRDALRSPPAGPGRRVPRPRTAFRRAAISGDDPEPLEPRQDVELGDRQAVEPVQPRSVARGDRIVPAAAPRTAGRDAELATLRPQPLAALVEQLGGKRSAADPRAVRLRHAEDTADARWSDSQTRCTRRRRRCASWSRTDRSRR